MNLESRGDWPVLAAFMRRLFRPSTEPPPVDDWQRLVIAAEEHRVAPLLARLAGGEHDRLKAAAVAATVRSLAALAALREIAGAFTARGIPFVAWKGPSLSQAAWGDATLRRSDDIDIVVAPQARHAARAAVRAIGWTSRHAMSDAQEDVVFAAQRAYEFTRPGEASLLEVHWAFGARRYAGFPPPAGIIAGAARETVGGVDLPVPSAVDTLLLHAVHATKHGWSTMEDVVVFTQLASADAVLTRDAARRAAAVGAALPLSLGAALARRVLGTDILPDGSLTAPSADDDRDARRGDANELGRLVDAVLGRWSAGATSWRSTLAWDLAWTERRRDRARLLARSLFDPTLQEWRAVRLPAPLGPLYRIVRPVRLLARAFTR